MIKNITRLSLTLCFGLAASGGAHAQDLAVFEKEFIGHIQTKFSDFRIVKKPESYPERFNASVELHIRAASPTGETDNRALVTLHDGVTGEPMESCYTPCTLHKSTGRKVFVFPYKLGHFTFPYEIEADPDEMRAKYAHWDDDYEVKLGPDFRDTYKRSAQCSAEFAKMERTDRDAEPCYRMPPPVPEVDYSGNCVVTFDVTPEGSTANAKASCTDAAFRMTSLIAVDAWKYHPKIDRGVPVTRSGVETRLRYEITDFDDWLLDENGNRVDE